MPKLMGKRDLGIFKRYGRTIITNIKRKSVIIYSDLAQEEPL